MLKKLELNNFKRHEHLVIDFTPGLNGIFGANYTGKTTILNAILYCLGGSSAIHGKTLVTRGKNTGFKQTLVFACDGIDYTVERTKSSAKLWKGEDDLLATGTTPVNAHITQLIGMDMKLFKQLRYGEQKKTDAILTLGVTKLHEILEKLTGLDDVNSALEKLREILKKEEIVLETVTYTDPKDLKDEIKGNEHLVKGSSMLLTSLEKELEAVETKLADTQEKLVEARAEKNAYDERVKSSTELKSSITVAETELTGLLSRKNEVAEQVPTDEEFDELWEAAQELREESIAAKAADDALTHATNAHERSLVAFTDADTAHKAAVKAFEGITPLPEGARTPEQLADEVANSRAKVIAHNVTLARVKELEGKDECPTCGQAVEAHADVDAINAEIEVLKVRVREANEEIRQATLYREEEIRLSGRVQAAETRLDLATEEHNQATQALSKATKAAKKFKTPYATIQDNLLAAEKRIREMESAIELSETLQPKIDKATAKVERLKDSLAELKVGEWGPEIMDALSDRIRAINEEKLDVVERRGDSKTKLATAEQALENLKAELKRATKDNLIHTESKSRSIAGKALQKYLRDNRDRYMSNMWSTFMISASEFVTACTNGRIEGISRSIDGDFDFYEEGYEMSLGEASGAQKAIMGLGVQMALAESCECPLDILMVDEPSGDMDAEHSLATAMMLSSKGKQVIMISHNEMDNSVCENVITI